VPALCFSCDPAGVGAGFRRRLGGAVASATGFVRLVEVDMGILLRRRRAVGVAS
jgi:hypothetical protein